MDNFNEVLDYQEDAGGLHPEDHLASHSKRIGNYFLDSIGVNIIYYVLGFSLNIVDFENEAMSGGALILLLLINPAYWIFTEAIFGKSPAKFITNTRVVTKNGEQPSFWTIVGRTLCRLIPFEAFSFLGSRAVGWHDSISNTRVVNDSPEWREQVGA